MHIMMLRYGETIWSSESVTPKTGQLRKSARGAPLSGQVRVSLLPFRRTTANWWRISAFLRDILREVWRERERPRLGGCAGRPQRTRLSRHIP